MYEIIVGKFKRTVNTSGRFSTILYEDENSCDFLFAFLHIIPLLKKVKSKRKRFTLNVNNLLANSFLLKWVPFQKGGKIILTKLFPLKVYYFPLKHS